MPKPNKFIFWTPRIISILFVIFLALFSLDIFDGNYGFWGTIVGLFMHNIPAIILFVVIIISWKYEIVGGIAFILAGIFYIFMLLMNRQLEWYMLFVVAYNCRAFNSCWNPILNRMEAEEKEKAKKEVKLAS